MLFLSEYKCKDFNTLFYHPILSMIHDAFW
jgi:hypothetical protein